MNLSLLLYSSLVVAVSAATNLTAIIAEVPPCALSCLITAFESSPAALIDPSSTCTNVTIQAQLSACIQGVCTYVEQAQIGVVNAQLCVGKPRESRQSELYISGYVCCIMSFVAIILRCYYRYTFTNSIGHDDWTIIAAGLVLTGVLTTDLLNLSYGFGTHYWDIDPLKITNLLKVFYAAEVLYVVVLTLTKISILFFYLRVFPGRKFRTVVWILLVFVASTGVTFVLIIIFQCHPLSGVFDLAVNSTCLNINIVAFTSGGFSIGQDIIILLLPIPELSRLNMNLRKKLNLLFMFSIGGLACVTSIIRLKFIVAFGSSTDQSWDDITPAVWSLIEINVSIVCACLPTMRALFARWLPALFDFGNSHYTHTPDGSAAKHPPRFKPFDSTNSSKSAYMKQPETSSSTATADEELVAIIPQGSKGQVYQYGAKQARGSKVDGNLPIVTEQLDDGLNTDSRTGEVELRRSENNPRVENFFESDSSINTRVSTSGTSKVENPTGINTHVLMSSSSKAEEIMGINRKGEDVVQGSHAFPQARLNRSIDSSIKRPVATNGTSKVQGLHFFPQARLNRSIDSNIKRPVSMTGTPKAEETMGTNGKGEDVVQGLHYPQARLNRPIDPTIKTPVSTNSTSNADETVGINQNGEDVVQGLQPYTQVRLNRHIGRQIQEYI